MSAIKLAASNIGWSAEDDDIIMTHMYGLGFQGLEVAPTRIVEEDPYAHCDEALAFKDEVAERFGLEICSMQSIWRGRTENIFDTEGAAVLLDFTDEALAFAQGIGCGNLVFGCPKNRVMPETASPEAACEFFQDLGKRAAAAKTVVALEANPVIYGTNFLNTTPEAFAFLKTFDAPQGLGINLDLGTIIYNDEDVREVEEMLPYINHIHISEPHLAPVGYRSDHRVLRDLLQESKYDGYVSLEMATVPADEMKRSLEYMAEMFA